LREEFKGNTNFIQEKKDGGSIKSLYNNKIISIYLSKVETNCPTKFIFTK
jgi:hypothetical protein